MDNSCEKCDPPAEFPFPFKPYNIQLNFMKLLYRVLSEKKLGIFESPTGTGKSMSIICGSSKWLRDYNKHTKQKLDDQITALETVKQSYDKEEVDWFDAQTKTIEISRELQKLQEEKKKTEAYDEKINKIIHHKIKQFKKMHSKPEEKQTNCNELLEVEDDNDDIIIEETGYMEEFPDEEEEQDITLHYQPTQIIIASRTHSQLSQFVGEIKKSPFHDMRVISLASRQNYCINANVKKLNSVHLINEKCLDMQRKTQTRSQTDNDGKVLKKQKNAKCPQCPYYKQSNIEDLRDYALSDVLDIEELVHAGKEISACPYYASRKAAEDAEILLVPYNTLLHKSTREASGIKLKNNVIIIDEAHNLLEALAQMYGSEVTFPHLYYSLHSLKCYKQRYSTMFSALTLRSLNQLIFVVNKLLVVLDKESKGDTTEIFNVEKFVSVAEIDQYNFFNLIKFCKLSKLVQKVRSYCLKYPISEEVHKKPVTKGGVKSFLKSIQKNSIPEVEEKPDKAPKIPIPNNPLLSVISFLESLTYSYDDGRILITKNANKEQCKMQFLLLSSTSNFSDIVKEARSIIVAGGTMKPYEEFRDRLFIGSGASASRIIEFSCDHIIPPENILPIAITKGLKGEKLLFNFNNRMSMVSPLKDIIKQACLSIKGGIVVFFPSYNYENWVYEQVKSTDFGRTLFREPQKSCMVDEVLDKYAATIKNSSTGAMMFSVVGGKLSEGLNFSDDLGRCVVVVGMPYANIKAADLKEKMSFLDRKEGHGAGQKLYENLCMKAVNQCIGRAVRHRNDYACVLLLDERYGKNNVNTALPDWIKRSLKICEGQEAFRLVTEFFKNKRRD